MIDLWGFMFKIEEYLAVWHMWQPRTVILIGAMFLSGYEFVLGTLLMMGCYKRVAPWGLMLTMVVMLPLTAWIWLTDPVSDCGCFGEFLQISNAATFFKNVAITLCLVLLIVWNKTLAQALFNPAIQWIVGAWITLYAIVVGLYGYNVQPMVDFRPFPVGTSLVATDDGTDENFVFIYEKDGHTQQFTLDNLPDSTWTFVDRIANADADDAEVNGLAIFDGDENVTDVVISGQGKELLLVVSEPKRAGVTFTYTVNEIYEYADSIGVPFVALLGTDADGVKVWRDISMAEYPIYTADDTRLKELARGNMALVILEDGVVASKVSISAIDPDAVESPSSPDELFEELQGFGRGWFAFVNVFFGGALLLLYLFQGIILAVRAKFKRAYRRKTVNIS